MATYSAGSATVDIVPSLKGFQRAIKRELKAINPTLDVEVNPQFGRFKEQVAAATRGVTATVQVDADTAKARAALDKLNRSANTRATVNVDADTSRATSKLRQLKKDAQITGYVSLTVLGAGAIGAITALPAILAAGAGPAAALGVALNGVGDALGAYNDAAKSAGSNAQALAKAQTQSARAIADAQHGVQQASIAAGRAQVQAARSVQSAEESLTSAKRSLQQAQDNVNKAVQEAIQAQQDLAFQARGAALDQKQAALDLEDAKAALDNAQASGASGKELEQLTLNYQRANLQLDEATAKNKELATEQQKSTAAGIQGSDQVVAAKQAEADAADEVRKATVNLQQTQVDASQQIADAMDQQAQAQLQLTRALEDSGDVGSSAVSKINDAMAQLSPNAQAFVKAIQALRPELSAVGDAVQNAFFAGAGAGFTNFVTAILPTMKKGLVDVASALNFVIQYLAKFLAASPMMQLFATLWSQIAQVVKAAAPLIAGLIAAFLTLATAAMPAIISLVNALSTLGPTIVAAIAPLTASGVFQQALGSIAQLVSALVPIVGILLQVGVQVLSVLGPILAQAVTSLQGPLQSIGQLLISIAPAIGALLQAIVALIPPLVSILVPVFGVLTTVLQACMPIIQVIGNLLAGLAPVFASLAAALTPVITILVAALAPILQAIVPIITQLAQILVNFLAGAFKALLPPLVQLLAVLGPSLMAVLTALMPAISQIADVLNRVFTALGPVIGAVAGFVAQLVGALAPILPPIANLIVTLVDAVLPLLPPLLALGNALFPLIISVIQTLMPILNFLINILSGVLAVVLRTVVIPILNLLVDALRVVIQVLDFLWKSIVKPVFDAIGAAATWLWNNALKPAFDAIGDATKRVGDFFTKMGDTIGGIWDGIKKLVHGGIQGIVDIVYNNGIRALANAVIKYIPGVDYLPELKVPEFAQGGFVSGPGTGTSDSIPALLSNGEYVMTAAATAKYLPMLEAMRSNRFATGGLVGAATPPAATSQSSPLAITGTADTAGLTAIQETSDAAVASLQALADFIAKTMNPAFAAMAAANLLATNGLVDNANTLAARNLLLSQQLATYWQQITYTVNASVSAQSAAFNALNSGMANVRATMQNTADWAVSQWARIRAAAADPIRWVLQQPMNAGLIAAWNKLNSDFALGKAVNPIPVGFATGGYVSGPGTGTSDSIAARLSNGEFVMPASITKRARPFLEALRAGTPEALQAAGVPVPRFAEGGLVDIHGQQTGAAIAGAVKFAKAESGKPYIWGGVGPVGYDCSGFMSAITNVLRGEQPHKRLGVAAGEPWPGFARGLGGAFALGASSVHTAGTLAGVNVESGGSPSRVKYGIGAVGADSSQFPVKSFLPIVGGKFVSGGPGGAFLDPSAIAEQAFASALGDANSTAGRWPGNRSADFAGAIAVQAIKAVQGKAVEALSAALAPQGNGGAGVEQWRGVVLQALSRVGQSPGLVDIVLRRMNQESSGNPRAINDWDINAKRGTPSKGLMQVIDPTFQAYRDPSLPDDIWNPLSNLVASMRYALARYGSLAAAFNRAGGYRTGGVVPGSGNGDTVPAWLTPGERVLTVQQTRAFDRLVSNLTRNLPASETSSYSSSGVTINNTVNPSPGMDERAIAVDTSRRTAFALRSK